MYKKNKTKNKLPYLMYQFNCYFSTADCELFKKFVTSIAIILTIIISITTVLYGSTIHYFLQECCAVKVTVIYVFIYFDTLERRRKQY